MKKWLRMAVGIVAVSCILLNAQVVYAHSYSVVGRREPTCTENGYVHYSCNDCQVNYQQTLPSVGHNYAKTVTPATCIQEGLITYQCRRCGDVYTEEIPLLQHQYQLQEQKAATDTEDGFEEYVCKICKTGYKEPIPARGHDYDIDETEPTCMEEGKRIYRCRRCNYSYTEYTGGLLEHAYVLAEEKKPTDTEAGMKGFVCEMCGHRKEDRIPALGHDYEVEEVEASCDAPGRRTYTCKRCQDTYTEKTGEKKQHAYELVSETEPTERVEGKRTYACRYCGDEKVETIPLKVISKKKEQLQVQPIKIPVTASVENPIQNIVFLSLVSMTAGCGAMVVSDFRLLYWYKKRAKKNRERRNWV